MAWRLAKSLATLLAEANAVAPNRNKRNDGTIGDAAHAARASSHNPNAYGVVTALDITHDPAGGMDCGALFEYLRTHPHPELRYIIHNRKVARRTSGWEVKNYTGSNPHTGHIHTAVGAGTDSNPLPPYDSTQAWGIAAAFGEEDDMTDEDRKLLKLSRVSDIARSYDMEIIKALVRGDEDVAARLEAEKGAAVETERKRLGL